MGEIDVNNTHLMVNTHFSSNIYMQYPQIKDYVSYNNNKTHIKDVDFLDENTKNMDMNLEYGNINNDCEVTKSKISPRIIAVFIHVIFYLFVLLNVVMNNFVFVS